MIIIRNLGSKESLGIKFKEGICAEFCLTLFRMGILGAEQGWGGAKRPPSLKSVTHPTLMKLSTVIPYLNRIQKLYESRDTLPEFC